MQKTAYEVRISDWSSDVCSSDLPVFDAFPDQVEFKPMGEGFTWDTQDRARDIAMARRAWEEVKRMIADPGYDMVVADELNIVLRYDYLPLDEVVAALKAKPAMTHVIVTGRNAPDALDRKSTRLNSSH